MESVIMTAVIPNFWIEPLSDCATVKLNFARTVKCERTTNLLNLIPVNLNLMAQYNYKC